MSTAATEVQGGATFTHQRRRAGDASPGSGDVALTESDTEASCKENGAPAGNGVYQQLRPHPHPSPSARRRPSDNWVLYAKEFPKSLASGKHVGRTVVVILVVTMFFTACLCYLHMLHGGDTVDSGGIIVTTTTTETDITIIKNIKNEASADVQNVISESESESEFSGSTGKRRPVEEFPVS